MLQGIETREKALLGMIWPYDADIVVNVKRWCIHVRATLIDLKAENQDLSKAPLSLFLFTHLLRISKEVWLLERRTTAAPKFASQTNTRQIERAWFIHVDTANGQLCRNRAEFDVWHSDNCFKSHKLVRLLVQMVMLITESRIGFNIRKRKKTLRIS